MVNKSNVFVFLVGVCFFLGIGGYFLGGGYGNLMSKYGFFVDNIIDVMLVDVNGIFLDSKLMGEDFFWVMSGGGGVSFGVIVVWKMKLVFVFL